MDVFILEAIGIPLALTTFFPLRFEHTDLREQNMVLSLCITHKAANTGALNHYRWLARTSKDLSNSGLVHTRSLQVF